MEEILLVRKYLDLRWAIDLSCVSDFVRHYFQNCRLLCVLLISFVTTFRAVVYQLTRITVRLVRGTKSLDRAGIPWFLSRDCFLRGGNLGVQDGFTFHVSCSNK